MKKAQRTLTICMLFCLLLAMLPAQATAGTCRHQHYDCGWEPAAPGSPCTCETTNGVHTEDCTYWPPVPESPCNHSHDASCGYYDEPGHEHSWSSWREDSRYHWQTCVDQGCDENRLKEKHKDTDGSGKCDKCGFEMHTHSYTAAVTAPACSEQGYTTYTCECGDSYVSDYVDAHGHKWGDYQSASGNHIRYCEVDSNHVEKEKCTEYLSYQDEDYHISKCRVCGGYWDRKPHNLHLLENAINGTEHIFSCNCSPTGDMQVYTIEEEHIYDGIEDTDCNVCGHERCEVHVWDEYITSGGHERSCKACGAYDISPHKFTLSPYDENYHAFSCPDCGYFDNESKKEHSMQPVSGQEHFFECTECKWKTTEHQYTIYKPSEYTPHIIHVAYCACGEMSDPAIVENHTWKQSYDKDGHVRHCTVCGYTERTTAHSLTVDYKDYSGHGKACSGCDHVGSLTPHNYEYVPSATAGYHDAVCSECKYTSQSKCSYEIDSDETHHWEVCGSCGYQGKKTEHADYTKDTKCDVCSSDMPVKTNVPVRINKDAVVKDVTFQPTKGVTLPDDAEVIVKDYTATIEPVAVLVGSDVGIEYDPAALKAHDDIYLGRITAGDTAIADLTPGKTYNAYVVGANDIHLEGAENVGGIVTQTFEVPAELAGNMHVQFTAYHGLVEGYELGKTLLSEDGKTLIATYEIDGFSPFIVYAFDEAELPQTKQLSALNEANAD